MSLYQNNSVHFPTSRFLHLDGWQWGPTKVKSQACLTKFQQPSLLSLASMLSAASASTQGDSVRDEAGSDCISPEDGNGEEALSPPPPAYDDPIHPWNDKLPAHWTSWKVEPREEEGQEKLPPYECTVYKMGFVKLKRELKRPGVLSGHRSWTQVYLKLWGTMIQIYKKAPQSDGHKPLWSFSMENMQITVPSDYKKYRHVIRLQVPDGPRFLVRTTNATDQNLWIEHLQASANVSSDIDSRSMPQFITLSRHRRRTAGHRSSSTAAGQPAALI